MTMLSLPCVVAGSASYLELKEFASLVTTSHEVHEHSATDHFAKCVAYLVPEAKLSFESAFKFVSTLINSHQKLTKHLEKRPPQSDPTHVGHFGKTLVSNFIFEDAREDTSVYVNNHRQMTVEWSESLCLSSKVTVQGALLEDGTKFDLQLQLIFHKRTKEMAVTLECTLDTQAMQIAEHPFFGWFEVDVKAAPNSTLLLNMPDVLVKVNANGELKGMCHVKKVEQLEQMLKKGIVCSISVRSLTADTFKGRYAHTLNLDARQ